MYPSGNNKAKGLIKINKCFMFIEKLNVSITFIGRNINFVEVILRLLLGFLCLTQNHYAEISFHFAITLITIIYSHFLKLEILEILFKI